MHINFLVIWILQVGFKKGFGLDFNPCLKKDLGLDFDQILRIGFGLDLYSKMKGFCATLLMILR